MSVDLTLFYITLLSQIFLISYYYPRKMQQRLTVMLAKFPPADYPKLYPKPYDYYAENGARKSLRIFRFLNLSIILVGLAILVAAIRSGYTLDPLGGDEILIVMFAMLQAVPHMLVELSTSRYNKRMKEMNASSTRKANLSPRRLSDFVSPIYVLLAVILYFVWLTFYFYSKGFDMPWGDEVYISVGITTGVNLFIAAMIFVHISGATLNRHQAYSSQLRTIETVVKAGVFVSILMSVFLILTDVVDQYAWERYDPLLTSLYIQLVMMFGLGLRLRISKIEDIDFEDYKEDVPGGALSN